MFLIFLKLYSYQYFFLIYELLGYNKLFRFLSIRIFQLNPLDGGRGSLSQYQLQPHLLLPLLLSIYQSILSKIHIPSRILYTFRCTLLTLFRAVLFFKYFSHTRKRTCLVTHFKRIHTQVILHIWISTVLKKNLHNLNITSHHCKI